MVCFDIMAFYGMVCLVCCSCGMLWHGMSSMVQSRYAMVLCVYSVVQLWYVMVWCV